MSDCDIRLLLLALMQVRGVGSVKAIGMVRDQSDSTSLGLWHDSTLRSTELDFRNLVRSRGFGLSETQCQILWKRAVNTLERCSDLGVTALSLFEENYPRQLSSLRDPPPILYVRGNVNALRNQLSVAIVGTRKPGKDGSRMAYEASQAAVAAGAVVVSGLAQGCDTAAHRGCLDAGGKTVAVLAQGLDKIYPESNRALADQIVDSGGALVVEHEPDSTVGAWAFVSRDRIQSGLSQCVFVVETGEDGGSMHAVRYGRDQRRRLACYLPPGDFEDVRYSGNQKMVNEMSAIPFTDAISFEEYLKSDDFAKPDCTW